MATIYPIGDPENDAERKAIRELDALLPDDYLLFHNFEVTTRRGFPYEVDVLVVGPYACYLMEVKGYKGQISGDPSRWRLSPSRASHPNPIPLANTKARVLHDKMAGKDRSLQGTLIISLILLTDDKVEVVQLRDDRRDRVVRIEEAADFVQDIKRVPFKNPRSIENRHARIVKALNGSRPSQKVRSIGLYDVVEKINQTDRRTVYLAKHRYLRTRPFTILQVYHFDPYLDESQRQSQIESIFHDQEALAHLRNHPNIISAGDMFAWDGNEFVLPHEFVEDAQTLLTLNEEEVARFDWNQVINIVLGTARGLDYAHEKSIIHRDVRPLNIVCEPSSGVVKIVNFDLALIGGRANISDWLGLDKELDRRYCAPEVWLDIASATRASDIYSLGLVFFEVITGERAVEDVEETLKSKKVPIEEQKVWDGLARWKKESASPQVCDMIQKMTAFSAEDRFDSLKQVIKNLEVLTDDGR